MNKRLNISNDYFIRTSNIEHYQVAQSIFKICFDAGDIYLGTYSGWYNTREEMFVKEIEAEVFGYKDITTGLPLIKMEEETYFFRLSKWKEKLIIHIQENPEFIQPFSQKEYILKQLEEDLPDLSISRKTLKWGIPLPNNPEHILYVWFDALVNYLSGICWPNSEKIKFWPPNLQIVGKDIMWFHCVIWPCMLLSANISLPKKIFGHGFVKDYLGTKMSKSLENVINPNDILDKYPSDSFRLNLVCLTNFGRDICFDKNSLILNHNSDLADTIGNLVNRCCVMISKYSNEILPNADPEQIFDTEELKIKTEKEFELSNIHCAYDLAIQSVKSINMYLTNRVPWKVKNLVERNIILRSALESIYISSHFLSPFIPETSYNIFKSLSAEPVAISSLKFGKNLQDGARIFPFRFSKIEK